MDRHAGVPRGRPARGPHRAALVATAPSSPATGCRASASWPTAAGVNVNTGPPVVRAPRARGPGAQRAGPRHVREPAARQRRRRPRPARAAPADRAARGARWRASLRRPARPASRAGAASRRGRTLLSTQELEAVRDELLARLRELDAAAAEAVRRGWSSSRSRKPCRRHPRGGRRRASPAPGQLGRRLAAPERARDLVDRARARAASVALRERAL